MIGNNVDANKIQVDVSRIEHRGEERLLLLFPYDTSLINHIKTIEGRKYTKTYKGWYLPYDLSSLIKLRELNISFAFKPSERNDSVFLQFEEHSRGVSKSKKETNKLLRKTNFLIDTLATSHKPLIERYIDYLYKQGYSWTGIRCFSQYAVAMLQENEESVALVLQFNLGTSDYKRMSEVFKNFRNQK